MCTPPLTGILWAPGISLEILDQCPQVEQIVVPIGAAASSRGSL